MGQAKRHREAARRDAGLDREGIARAVRAAVSSRAALAGLSGGLCGFHAAVGRALLAARFGIRAQLVAGDAQRRVTARVVHSYAGRGGQLDAATGACHVWLSLPATGAVVDFDAWEEPVRYDATDRPHGPWTGPRPEFYWFGPGETAPGLHALRPDRDATAYVEARLAGDSARRFVEAALAEALARLDAA